MNNNQIRNNLARFASSKRTQLRNLKIQVEELEAELQTLDAANQALGEPIDRALHRGTIRIETQKDLFDAMAHPTDSWITVNGVIGILQSVAREDGSGRKFNITLLNAGKANEPVTTYVSLD